MMFRDWLRENPKDREQYAELKRKLLQKNIKITVKNTQMKRASL